MALEASALVFDIHGRMLRTLCEVGDKHYQGLSAAAKDCYRAGLIPHQMQRRMLTVDQAFQVIRHISIVAVRKDSDELAEIMRKHKGDDYKEAAPHDRNHSAVWVKKESKKDCDSSNAEKRRRCDSPKPQHTSDGCSPRSKNDENDLTAVKNDLHSLTVKFASKLDEI